jgi:DNA-binding NtrC family response regulator
MDLDSHQALVRSPLATRAEALVDASGRRVSFTWLPGWLVAEAGIGSGLPVEVAGAAIVRHPLRALAQCALDMVESGLPLHEFLVALEPRSGDRLMLLVSGRIEPPGDRIELDLRDVTQIIGERQRAAAVGNYHGLVGKSLRMLEVYRRISIYGPAHAPVVITGETGTGKELVARALHERSPRADGPFVPVNCTALSPELFESELFGHEKGSFTGAHRQHVGRFERADGGTLFLDEIGDMPLYTQAKLLRALEEGVIERVGGESERRVDVRALAATNLPLERAVAAGRFRADLYHRLSVFRVHLPPLRERVGDIPLLVEHFIQVFNRRYDRQVKRLTPDALRILEEYTWPGNIRELRNVMERVFVESTGDAIGARALAGWIAERDYLMPGDWNADGLFQPRPPIIPGVEPGAPARTTAMTWPAASHALTIPPERVVIDVPAQPAPVEVTAEMLHQAFRRAGGNISGAARSLGMHKATFYRHMKRLGLEREDLEGTQ